MLTSVAGLLNGRERGGAGRRDLKTSSPKKKKEGVTTRERGKGRHC